MSGSTKQPPKETNSISTPLKPIEEELRWIDIMATDGTGNSALMIGIRDNKEDVVKFIIDRALSVNKLSEVLQIVNKDDENAYSLALRAENVALLRIIEDATEKEKKQNLRKTRKFLKYKSTESFKASPKRIEKMHRPKSEEAVGSASTSDVEPEIDDSLQFKNNQSEIHDALVKSLSELQSPGFEKRPSLTDSEGKSVEKTPTIKNLHSDSFTFEHETIDFTNNPLPTPGIMNSLGCKFRNLMSGRRDDPTRPSKRSSVTTTQVHFTSMPSDQNEVWDGSDNSYLNDPTSSKRLTIAHHHYTDSDGDNSVCVPPEFSGPEVVKKLSGDKSSGLTPMSEAIMKPIRNLRSRGQSSEGRARNYKTVPVEQQQGDYNI